MINRRLTVGNPAPAAPPSGYPAAVLLDTPLAYYRTAVGSTVPDETGNGHHGDLSRATVIAGPVDDAFSGFTVFDPSWAIALPSSLLVNGDESITIEMIYRIASGAASNSAFTIGNWAGRNPRCQAHMPYTDTIYWDYGDYDINLGRLSVNFAAYEDSAWHHIALAVDAHNPFTSGPGRQQIWVDGAKIGESDWAPYHGGGVPEAQALAGGYIGAWPSSGVAATPGDIAEFAVYDKALSSTEIAAHIAAI